MSNPSDWMQINFNDVSQIEVSPTAAAAAAATTTITSRTNNLGLDQAHVARPIRRRSRASRRTPTTLLNTDTTNFRAMVQHFTGSPTITSAARSQPSNPIGMFHFTQHIASPTTFVPPGSGFPVQNPDQMQQHNMFTVSNNRGGGAASHGPPASSSTNECRDFDNYTF